MLFVQKLGLSFQGLETNVAVAHFWTNKQFIKTDL